MAGYSGESAANEEVGGGRRGALHGPRYLAFNGEWKEVVPPAMEGSLYSTGSDKGTRELHGITVLEYLERELGFMAARNTARPLILSLSKKRAGKPGNISDLGKLSLGR